MNNPLIEAAARLSKTVQNLQFGPPVSHVYNPLDYAWKAHEEYLRRYGGGPKKVVFMGMNPGPWGMAQTGIPFGEVDSATRWMGIDERIGKPAKEHPKRPIEGFGCRRSEVSGRRLWGLFAERFGAADRFFTDHFVLNYCPLVFMAESGRNITPDKLPAREAEPLFAAADLHLRRVMEIAHPDWMIGVGAFAAKKLERLFGTGRTIGRILHPSPASPAANRGWAQAATRQLEKIGVWKPM